MLRELEIVEQLILGQDPLHRGQALHTPKDPALDQARAIYYQQLKRVSKQHASQPVPPSAPVRPGHSRAGERWSIAEDNRLSALWETSSTVTSADLAEKLGRSRAAIMPGWCASANIRTAMRYGRWTGRGEAIWGGMTERLQ
ncbi:hypothetical protein [Aquitalea pelogenes]|uniref:hypothetical protein n=1 Tax=Aquitalea pelogenes TaxID=1293573 RepID=UPI00078781CB|nr:hypothetical protein [Aquitalea pelogenes]